MCIAQDLILGDTFRRTMRIFDRITPTAVQQTMVSPCGAVIKIATFNQNNLKSTQGGIPGDTGASCPAADYQDFSLYLVHTIPTFSESQISFAAMWLSLSNLNRRRTSSIEKHHNRRPPGLKGDRR